MLYISILYWNKIVFFAYLQTVPAILLKKSINRFLILATLIVHLSFQMKFAYLQRFRQAVCEV